MLTAPLLRTKTCKCTKRADILIPEVARWVTWWRPGLAISGAKRKVLGPPANHLLALDAALLVGQRLFDTQ